MPAVSDPGALVVAAVAVRVPDLAGHADPDFTDLNPMTRALCPRCRLRSKLFCAVRYFAQPVFRQGKSPNAIRARNRFEARNAIL